MAASGRWVLKGAVALDFRLGDRARTTKDVDLVRRDDEEAATTDLLGAQNLDLGDSFVFSLEKLGRPQDAEGDAVRYRVRSELGGRLFEEVLVDV
ncbi:MAG: nucleotidyl transferase AbiEii/AbiGii toxin family protein, partial [bacterium]